MAFQIRTYNQIAPSGLQAFPQSLYQVAPDIASPDGILLRSANLHEVPLPETVQGVARAGAGVNNIPVTSLSERGVPVFNAPGANANAVKELVLAGMLLGFRHLKQALVFVDELDPSSPDFERAVEGGKKRFVGHELPGRRLGVVGLGAIGGQVANAARGLGMEVIGFDPGLTVEHAWRLSSDVRQAPNLEALLAESDVVSLHVPLIEATRGLINADRLRVMKDDALLLNFARDGLVDRAALLEVLGKGRLSVYVTDFPHPELQGVERVLSLPHLGASTVEAEANSAVMVVNNLRDFLENGNIRHSVNFPEVIMPRTDGPRLAVANANVPNMVGQVGTTLAEAGLNIVDLLNRSKGDLAYTLIDVDGPVPDRVQAAIQAIDGVLRVRRIPDVGA
ncbi:D-3-phosphoglycerate dehydrogenase [Natronospira proteinivora]|uniref:D-3-phosphoglycerate dehydrogenase n=1 Tax=Natronospira proteinivora TaxID=1807133 RepID=A0ABT1G6Q2_9GAMM|nr:phosphoglycerate dehydrogenase [Natronospira proteinivora]MCP1726931.1 D-3-phosphoglycerate dehydrogenase [Natronospira proteinivora]